MSFSLQSTCAPWFIVWCLCGDMCALSCVCYGVRLVILARGPRVGETRGADSGPLVMGETR